MTKTPRLRSLPLTAIALAVAATTLAACGSSASSASPTDNPTTTNNKTSSGSAATQPGTAPATDTAAAAGATITIYSGQHESIVKDLVAAFTRDTGVKTTLRFGDDADLANQILEEGTHSPADVFLTEEPGAIGLVDSKGLLAPVAAQTLAEVDSRLVPGTKDWMPYAARSRVLVYNPKEIAVADLPKSIMDLTDPKWAGKFAYAPSGGFISTVSYLIDTIGTAKTETWLKGIKANGVNEQTNGKVRDTVEAGQHAFGLTNHYYWYIMAAAKGGEDKVTSRVYYFDHADAGGLLLASGAGVLKSSQHQAPAQRFLAWLGSPTGGQEVVAKDPSAQYPVAPGVNSEEGLPPLSSLHLPAVADPSIFADTSQAQGLIVAAGIV